MNNFITTFVVVLLAVISLTVSSNLSTAARTMHYLKEDIEVAVHDASMQVSDEHLADGQIVFEEEKAERTFRESFELNTGLEANDYELVEFKVMDHTTNTFPVEYKSTEIDFEDTFLYPTILAIVQTSTDKYFYIDEQKDITRVASYSYKLDENVENHTMLAANAVERVIDSEVNSKGLHWVVPYTKNTTSQFGYRKHPITKEWKLHAGMDIASAGIINQPVISAKDGIVTYAGVMGGYGNLVEVKHDENLTTRYAHLNSIQVTIGQSVEGGQVVGNVGSTGNSTGPHLHYETIYKGKQVDPRLFY